MLIDEGNYKLYKGDCLETMDELIEFEAKFDAVITDPPYGTTKNKWDSVIPFDKMWERVNKLIKPNGAIILFSQGLFTVDLINSNRKDWKYNLIWEKDRPTGFLNAKRMPLRSHEDICVFYKKLPVYNPQFWEGNPLHGMGSKYRQNISTNNNYGNFDSRTNPSANRAGDKTKYPRSILKFNKPHPPIHPTQKPVDLLEYLLKTYTNEGELVLDFTMGSGSTGVACLNTNRKFIGIELDEKYFNMAVKRLKDMEK